MRKLLTLLFCLATILSTGCSSEREINASNSRTARRSVTVIKEYLPEKEKLEFQIAYWTIKAANPEMSDFLDAIDGKTAEELIAAGRQTFEERKASVPAYQEFGSWDAMIENYRKEREQQDMGIKKDQSQLEEERRQRELDRRNNVLYNLR
ncbi:MAG: DUF6694 family lipoprotein [Gammaproteobacteria bacterium]